MSSNVSVGAKMTLDGESDFRKAVSSITKEYSVLRSAMKLCEAEFKNNENSVEALTKKQEILEKEHETQNKKINLLTAALENAKKQYGENSDQVNDWQIKINKAKATLTSLDGELSQNKAKLEEAEKGTDDTTEAVEELDEEIQDGTKSTEVFGDVLKANLVSEALIGGIKMLANGIKSIGKNAISVGSSFEKAMSEVSAISGATGESLDALTEKAAEMGAKTKFSATESAEAFTYMAMAGWKTEDMLDGIEGIMNLAAASGEDLATTSDIVTDALTAFGLSAEDSGHFADILAAASSNANTNVSMMGETFKYCAPIAGALGFSAEDTAEAIGLMANAGIKSSQAGTALRMIMNNLSSSITICGEKIGEVTVETTNADGSMRELSDILEDCRSAFSGLSESEKVSTAQKIAGTNAMSGFLALMNAAPADIKKLSSAIEDCDGASANMAATMNDNLDGSLTILDSTLEGVGITIYDKFENTFKNAVDTAIDSIGDLNGEMKYGELGDSLDSLAESLDEASNSMIECAVDALPGLINGMAFLIDNRDGIAAVAFGGAAAWAAYEIAVNGAKTAQEALNFVQNLSPTGLLIAGIAGVTAGLGAYIEKATEAEEVTDDIADAGKEWNERAETLTAAVKESSDAYDTNSKSIEVDRQANMALAKQLEELVKKEELTNEEQLLMQSTIDQLNDAVPGLSLYFDENTGALNRNNREIEDMIDNYSTYLQVQAAQELLYDLTKQQIEVQMQLNDANREYDELVANSTKRMEEYDAACDNLSWNVVDYWKNVNTTKEAWQEAADTVAANNDAVNELNDTYTENQKRIDNLTQYINENAGALSYETDMLAEQEAAEKAAAEAMETAEKAAAEEAEAIKKLALKHFEYKGAVYEVTEASYERLELMQEKYNEVYQSAYESISGQMGLFDEFSSESTVTTEEMLKNLQTQIDGMNTWAEDMQTLSDRGVNQGLLETLRDMGPESYKYTHQLVTMTDEQLRQLNGLYSEKLTIQDSLAKEMVDADGTLQKQMDTMIENAAAKAQAMRAVGEQTGQGFLEGLWSKRESIVESGISLAGGLIEGVRNKLQIHSPSRVTKEMGMYTGEGYEEGAVISFREANEAIERELEKLSSVDTSVPVLHTQTRTLAGCETENAGALGRVLELLTVIANKSSNIYLDSGELVGGLRDEMDNSLGDLQVIKAMGALR